MFRITIFTALLLLSFLPLSGQVQQAEQVLGRASYYAGRFHGRKMSNGTSYHRDSLTCAHRTYPFGTLLEVTNPKNNKRVIVKVTDRGPYMRNRIIDVSHAAAQQLGMLKQGVIQVVIREHIPDADLWQMNPTSSRLRRNREHPTCGYLSPCSVSPTW